jgi:phosphopantothenoylcysteine decarboxylase/phosphopantothenate--cysteine ligase
VVRVETAQQMLDACKAALPVDVAVCAAAVADWKPAKAETRKIKKNGAPPEIALAPNPDILAALSAAGNLRPRLVIGFAAETESDAKKLIAVARTKRAAKGCDWIVANDVGPGSGTFGGDANAVHVVDETGAESWPQLAKAEVAERLAQRITEFFTRSA